MLVTETEQDAFFLNVFRWLRDNRYCSHVGKSVYVCFIRNKIMAGIGRSLALRLSKYKGQVFALSRTKVNLDSLVATDPRIQAVCIDLRDWDAIRKAVQSILPIDLLVNNAGVGYLLPFVDATLEQFDLTFDVNVKAVLNVSQIVAKNMIERKSGGGIVNVSSQAGQAALKDHAVYCASKGALDMLTK